MDNEVDGKWLGLLSQKSCDNGAKFIWWSSICHFRHWYWYFRDWYWDCSTSVCINDLHGGTQYILSRFVHDTKLGEVVGALEDCCTEGPGQPGEMH